LRDKFGRSRVITPENGVSLEPALQSAWSTPQQVEVEYAADLFAVTQHYAQSPYSDAFRGSTVTIRLENTGEVYIGVQPYDHPSILKSISLPWQEFVKGMLSLVVLGEEENKEALHCEKCKRLYEPIRSNLQDYA